jgi:hypothetical protein
MPPDARHACPQTRSWTLLWAFGLAIQQPRELCDTPTLLGFCSAQKLTECSIVSRILWCEDRLQPACSK